MLFRSGINLSSAYLYPIDLSGANLTGAILRRCTIIDGRFSRTEFSRADLRDARMDEADLTGANFYMARLDRSSLQGVILKRASLIRAKLRKASLAGADLTGASITNARFDRTSLFGSCLKDVDLEGCDFSSCAPVSAHLAHVAPGCGETARPTSRDVGATGAPVLAEALGGFWGYPSVHGWGNMGKDG